jgi:hypothetical protein
MRAVLESVTLADIAAGALPTEVLSLSVAQEAAKSR